MASPGVPLDRSAPQRVAAIIPAHDVGHDVAATVRACRAIPGVDLLIAARRKLHNSMLGVKFEARALYGPNSDQVAALGLKKKLEQSKKRKTKKAEE